MAPLWGVLCSSLFSNITTFFSSPYATMGLIVIMVLSLTRMAKAMCLALLTLGVMSCTKQNDAPREELVASSTASLSSENTGEKITLDLSATAEALDLPIAPASEGKALDYQIKNSLRRLPSSSMRTRRSTSSSSSFVLSGRLSTPMLSRLGSVTHTITSSASVKCRLLSLRISPMLVTTSKQWSSWCLTTSPNRSS